MFIRHRCVVASALLVSMIALGSSPLAPRLSSQPSPHAHDADRTRRWVAPEFDHDDPTDAWLPTGEVGVAQDARRAWATFESTMGAGWMVNPDLVFGTPRWIVGPGLAVAPAGLTDDQCRAHARTMLGTIGPALGVDDLAALALQHTERIPNAHGQEIVALDFKQTLDGWDVRSLYEGRRVRFVFNATLGKLSALGSDWIPGLSVRTDGAMGRDDAVRKAQDYMPAYAPGTGRLHRFDTYVLVARPAMGRPEARLVHEIEVVVEAPAHQWRVILDARTGELLYRGDHLHHVDVIGTASIGTLDGAAGTPPAVPFSVKPAVDLFVGIVGGKAVATDIAGSFRIPHGGAAPVTLAGRYDGRWCKVTNALGVDTTFSLAATPGTAANIVLNGVHATEAQTAEATAYHWVTRMHHYVQNLWPGFRGIPRLPTYVNFSLECAAYMAGSAILFSRAGSWCNNTAVPDVIAHEYGHMFHQYFGGRITNTGFSEGISDHLALFVMGQRVLGRGLSLRTPAVRDYRPGGPANRTQWPKTNVRHRDGEIWAGMMMDMRDNLIAKHGASVGVVIAEGIGIGQYALRPADMPSAVIGTMLLDDNDADLANGTPNFREIAAAADRHNLPRPLDPPIVKIAHAPLRNASDVVNGYPVTAGITSPVAPIARAQLLYRVNGGAVVTVPMQRQSGSAYTATIPAQSPLSRVDYVVRGVDQQNNMTDDPRVGFHSFVVGRTIVPIADDFEIDRGWRPGANDSAITGRFHRADPFAATYLGFFKSQPEDDATPGTGVYCYVTQNGNRGQDAGAHDVDGGMTSLISPMFDFASVAPGFASMDFDYWYTAHSAQNAQPLTVSISTDGGTTWRDFHQRRNSNPAWVSVKGLALPGPYTRTMRLRFWIGEAGNSFAVNDVLVDNVVVRGVDDNVVELRAQTRTPAPGVVLDYTLRAAKEANAGFVFALSDKPAATRIPGLGTLRLGFPIVPWIPSGSLDTSGRARFRLPIPNNPALRGKRVYTQAIVTGGRNVLSNAWVVDIQ